MSWKCKMWNARVTLHKFSLMQMFNELLCFVNSDINKDLLSLCTYIILPSAVVGCAKRKSISI